MDPYLMGAAGFQAYGNQAVPVFFVQKPVVGYGRLSFFKIHKPLNDRALFSAERGADRAGFRADLPADNGKIFPADLLFLCHA